MLLVEASLWPLAGKTLVGMSVLTRSIGRVGKKSLAAAGARFSVEGLRFHFERLSRYTNPYGGGLDKRPINTIATVRWFQEYWKPTEQRIENPVDETAEAESRPKTTPAYLLKKGLYQVADHLLGRGKVAYWTGSLGRTTLLGLDIDDHQSASPEAIARNSSESLALFTEMTSWKPVTCPSKRGIHGFLILDKGWLTAHATNEMWHRLIRNVQAEAQRRSLSATLECKGKARIINEDVQYGGVLLKDPFTGMNPSDDDLRTFWADIEERRIDDSQLEDTLTTLECSTASANVSTTISDQNDVAAQDDTSSAHNLYVPGEWVKSCNKWASHGLQQHDSMAEAVFALTKWLYFVELWDTAEDDRYDRVVDLLQQFCLHKHNGYITRLSDHKPDEVLSHVCRIVKSAIRITDAASGIFAQIRAKRSSGQYKDNWQLSVPLSGITSNSVLFTQCCSVSRKDKGDKRHPEIWVPSNDESPLPREMEQRIREALKNTGAKEKTYTKLVRLLNHIRNEGGETRLGVVSLKKMGFSNHAARQHIAMLREMGVILIKEDYSPVLGLGKSFVLTAETRQALGMPVFDPD